jgi:carbamoyl-phosphate synthase large subunit
MKSTGEVLGIDLTYAGALLKGFIGAGIRLPKEGGRVLVSISDEEKAESVGTLQRFVDLGYTLVATRGTSELLKRHDIPHETINAIADGSPNVLDAITKRTVDLVINNAGGARRDSTDNFRIRRAAVEASIACLTSLDTAAALATALASEPGPPRSLQEYQALHRETIGAT